MADSRCPGGLSITVNFGDGTVITLPISNPCGGFVTIPPHTYNVEEGQQLDYVVTGNGPAPLWPQVAIWHVTFVEGDTFVVLPMTITAVAGTQFSGVVARFKNTTWPEHGVSDFTATIDWGDGSPVETVAPSLGPSPGIIEVRGSHTYMTDPSSLEVITTLKDPPPGTATAAAHTPIANCADQVALEEFVTQVPGGFFPEFSSADGCPPPDGGDAWLCVQTQTRVPGGAPGIRFQGRALIQDGPIPPDQITLRMVQNLLNVSGRWQY